MRRTKSTARVLVAAWITGLCLVAGSAGAVGSGDPAPAFSARSLTGPNTLTLAEHRGKVVYLDFWASWCGPCLVSLPALEELRGEFPGEQFQILAVNLDEDPSKARAFLERNPVGYPSAHDPKGQVPGRYGLETMPTSYLIDRKGVVRYVHEGFRKGDVDELRAQIRAALEER